jgi:hypothetical protein
VQHVPVDGAEENQDEKSYMENMNDAKLKKWIARPKNNVPDNLLPALKASFLCYSQGQRKEFIKLLSERTIKESSRFDPTSENYQIAL